LLIFSFGADSATIANVQAVLSGGSVTTTSSSATSGAFTRDLQLGITGSDVRALQQYLNAHGYIVAVTGAGSLGNESIYFGTATRAALSRYQTAHGIAPAAGYFGPKTRAKISGL